MYKVVNREDGYQVTLDETRRQSLTTAYTSAARTLSLRRGNEAWLRIAVTSGELLPGYVWLYKPEQGRPGCAVQFDSGQLTLDAVQYRVTRLDG